MNNLEVATGWEKNTDFPAPELYHGTTNLPNQEEQDVQI